MTSPCDSLQAVGVLEKDTNADLMWTWLYPAIDLPLRELLQRKSGFETTSTSSNSSAETVTLPSFVYGKYGTQFYYIVNTVTLPNGTNEDGTAVVDPEFPVLNKVTAFSVAVLAKEFHPEKYEGIAKLFATEYIAQKGDATAIVKAFLSIFTTGQYSSFSTDQFDIRKSYLAASLKNVIRTFGVESILIYTALLLKKRIIVYSDSLETLYDYVRPLPLLVWHRQNWDILHPYVHNNDAELEDLKSTSSFVAGFTDSGIEGSSDLYDLFINVNEKSISISPSAQESLALGKIHKELANFLLQASGEEAKSEQATVKAIAIKTNDLLGKISTYADESGKVTYESIKQIELPPSSVAFLWNLALSEGIGRL